MKKDNAGKGGESRRWVTIKTGWQGKGPREGGAGKDLKRGSQTASRGRYPRERGARWRLQRAVFC